ncbi:MAG: electron transfer flavoprotein subunit alpha/FixB family protein [Vicinamibacterales bacterium]
MILVIAEQKNGRLNRASWEAIAAAQALSAGQEPITVAVPGAAVDGAAAELAAADVAAVWAVGHAALATYTPDAYVAAVAAVVAELGPSHVCFAHTYQTRDFAATLAARLDRVLVTDVVGISRAADSTPLFARPMFQGKLVADMAADGPAPHLVSFQIGAFRGDAAARGGGAPVTVKAVTIDPAALRQTAEPPFQEAKAAVDLAQAERIVAIGRGIKAQEHLAMAEQLAAAFGAELAASRPICDNGWLPMERQIGSSGQTVAPKLYVAVGISGAIQHLVGMKGSRTIVAVNKDADAPIFEVADYGIQGDLFEIAPALIAALGPR